MMRATASINYRVFALLAAMCLFVAAAHSATPRIDVTVDKTDGIYQVGEHAVFTITPTSALPAEGLKIRYRFTRDSATTESAGSFILKPGAPFEIRRTLFRPGWLMCLISWDVPTTGSAAVGAIFSPLHIQPGLEKEPADFDAFWARQKASLAGDYAAEVVQLPSKTPGIDLYHVKIPIPEGNPVQGYMTKPHGAAPRSLGAIAFTHGAYVPARSSNIPPNLFGMIAFDFNAHGHDDGMPPKFYRDLSNTTERRYWDRGWENRDTVYFLGMYKRLMRAMDFLTRQAEWDGKVLVVFGGSQGGAQAIAAAGLEPRITCIVAGIPALCDLSGWRAGRIDGWPHPIKVGRDGLPLNPKIAATVPYYDNAYFARRIKCDAFFATGLIDLTCQPCTVFAAYNQLGSERKQILVLPDKAHSFSTDLAQRAIGEKFIKDHIERVTGKAGY
ncbi:acetylxylan esterase [bacterium]|nr:acetylxylan esterase [bacterium]